MDRSCENCCFCIYAHSMLGSDKEKAYCERHNEWIGSTILCSEWERVSAPKSITNADRIRAMSDEELADWIETIAPSGTYQFWLNGKTWLQWLRREAKDV